jgi:hypothetical protein
MSLDQGNVLAASCTPRLCRMISLAFSVTGVGRSL